MTTLLCLVLVVPLLALGLALARRERGGMLREQALAVAAIGGRDPRDVVTYTQDCTQVACMLLSRPGQASTGLLRRVLRDAVTQLDSVQRASRLRGAVGAGTLRRLGWGAWSEALLWLASVANASFVAKILAWRGRHGIDDLHDMTASAIARFNLTLASGDEAPLLTLFGEELVRLGLLDPDVLDDDPSEDARKLCRPTA